MQCVCMDGVLSDFLPLKREVTQGSILGPLLFLLFIKDLLDAVNVNEYTVSHLLTDDATPNFINTL